MLVSNLQYCRPTTRTLIKSSKHSCFSWTSIVSRVGIRPALPSGCFVIHRITKLSGSDQDVSVQVVLTANAQVAGPSPRTCC
ncbi:hypothetical protein CEXT_25991 [Caerostris extrusa]|uniref:Uncharacterized protein n=1 Tax=Caerostris extrusa TaxID=172846 RepID=A0AAV4YDL4_CAEEX|nr:hypothetical protein CEXT_25991 [Caerostris extrusa]